MAGLRNRRTEALMIQPEIGYATVGSDRVARQGLGEGPIDLLVTGSGIHF